jgi:hypothetical protein
MSTRARIVSSAPALSGSRPLVLATLSTATDCVPPNACLRIPVPAAPIAALPSLEVDPLDALTEPGQTCGWPNGAEDRLVRQ